MFSTINEARTPAELAEWLRLWAKAYEEGVDYLDDNDARQLAEAVERVCAPCNAAALREALEQAKRDHWFNMSPSLRNKIIVALSVPPEPPSNAAALREALSDACYAMFNFLKTQTGGYEEMAIALDKAKAALAAPPRNCDRFATANDAVEGYIAAHPHDDEPDASTYGSWLFAPAEGKEPDNG